MRTLPRTRCAVAICLPVTSTTKSAAFALALFATSIAPIAQATDYFVAPGAPASGTCTTASPCDLNYAISSSSGTDIRILIAAGTYGPALLHYGKSMNLIGSGDQSTTLQGAFSTCAVDFSLVDASIDASVSVSELTLDGSASSGYVVCSQPNNLAGTTLSLVRAHVTAGSSIGIFIHPASSSSVTLKVLETTIDGNAGGGIVFFGPGTLDIDRSLITANGSLTGSYGGLRINSNVTGTITNSTVVGNRNNGNGAGIQTYSATALVLDSVTLGGNLSASSGSDIDATSAVFHHALIDGGCTGTSVTGDYSIEGPGNTCGLTNSFTGATVSLAALADNGGPTRTSVPSAGVTLAIGGSGCQLVDQRDYVRTTTCDVGALQLDATAPDVIFDADFEATW